MGILESIQQRITKKEKEVSTSPCEERARTVQPGEEGAQGDLIRVCKYLKGGRKEGGARLFSVEPCGRTRGNRHQHAEEVLAQAAQRGAGVPCLDVALGTLLWVALPEQGSDRVGSSGPASLTTLLSALDDIQLAPSHHVLTNWALPATT